LSTRPTASNVATKTGTPRNHKRAVHRAAAFGIAGLLAAGGVLAGAAPASADPASSTWQRLRMCESSDRYNTNTGNGYYGAYQFDLPTWRSVGGTGLPNQAPPAEQDFRALYLYRMRGWEPWECAGILGLQDDNDGGSGVVPVRYSPPHPGVPAWPGKQFHVGDSSADLRKWQVQLHKRGLPFQGTGYFGATTLKYVKQIQRDNGLCVCGFIGPKTWSAAWTGRIEPAKHAAPKKIPAWPGVQYKVGDRSANLKKWQLQMKKLGFPFSGTGYFGPTTLKYVKQLQRDNHLRVVGFIGPKTWRAAWSGKK
jgi:peptidoglycan hydrolase-like protein with peptidoglycan-binding domain